jgi:hypothetical protein
MVTVIFFTIQMLAKSRAMNNAEPQQDQPSTGAGGASRVEH